MEFSLWLASLPLWQSALVMIGGGVLVSTLGVLAAAQFYPLARRMPGQQLGGMMAELYAVLVALCLVAALVGFQNAKAAVARETTALESLDRLSLTFADQTRQRLRAAIGRYAASVVEDEWASLGHGNEHPGTRTRLLQMTSAFAMAVPHNGQEQTVLISAHQQLERIADARSQRLAAAPGGPGAGLAGLALGFGLLLSLAMGWFGASQGLPAHLIKVGLLTGTTMAMLVAANQLLHPFTGPAGLTAEAFRQVIETQADLIPSDLAPTAGQGYHL